MERIMSAFTSYAQERMAHWNDVCLTYNAKRNAGRYYHQRLFVIFRHNIPAGSSILELGCGRGDLLGSLKPSRGVGIDFSEEFVRKARENHPHCTFIHADAHDFKLDEEFDYIILSDLINDVEDVQKLFLNLRHLCKPGTRIIINYYSHLWQGPLTLAERLGLKTPALEQNWLTMGDLKNLFYLADFDVIKVWQEILLPIGLHLLSGFASRYIAKTWPFRYLALTNFVIARPILLKKGEIAKDQTVTVVIPARNADMTVAPEDLPKFYECLNSGKAEFVNGVRLVYPMEKQAMRRIKFV
jgi:SAM-dependent methyltransferase